MSNTWDAFYDDEDEEEEVDLRVATQVSKEIIVKPKEEKNELFLTVINQFKFLDMKHMLVRNGIMFVVTESQFVRIKPDNNDKMLKETIDLKWKKNFFTPKKFFADTSGKHAIIISNKNEVVYINNDWQKFRLIADELHPNLQVESVGFNDVGEMEFSQVELLLGTKDSSIYYIKINAGLEKKFIVTFKKSFSLPVNTLPILNISILNYSTIAFKTLVFVSSSQKLYCFEGAKLENFFSDYTSKNLNFIEIKSSPLPKFTSLSFLYDQEEEAKKFIWISEDTIMEGEIDINDLKLKGKKLDLKYDGKMIGFEITDWHYLISTKETLFAFNFLDNKKAFQKIMPEKIQPIYSLCKDRKKNTFHFLSEKYIFNILPNQEDRNIWDLFLQRKDYANALKYAKNEHARETVQCAHADHLYASGDIEHAAIQYAKSIYYFSFFHYFFFFFNFF